MGPSLPRLQGLGLGLGLLTLTLTLTPGYKMEWHVGVRKKGELVAFISGKG